MPRFVAWGCNITGSLDPDVAEHILTRPTDITEDQIHEIIWVGWAATVGRTARGIRVWGSSNILDDAKVKDFDIGPVKRILGFDTIRGWLDELGHVHDFRGRQTTTTWDDMTISGHGTVYALTRTHGLVIFRSMDHLFSDGEPVRVIHPILSPIHPAKMYSMESRAFLHSLGPMQQLFEIVTTDNKGKPCEPSLTLIEDLEGMGMEIVPGSCNRLGIITDAGEAYVLGQRSREVDPLDVGDARLLGLGSDFDVVVIDHKVLTKGDNEYGQLGRTSRGGWAEVPEIEGKVTDVKCSRWGTFLTLSAS